jgi:adenylosuccinate lyase
MRSWQERRPFRELLDGDGEVTSRLDASKLDELFDYGFYVRHVDESFRRLGLS